MSIKPGLALESVKQFWPANDPVSARQHRSTLSTLIAYVALLDVRLGADGPHLNDQSTNRSVG